MCWIGVLWPQATSSRVRPNTRAMASRSSGLGVHRPSAMARTRCSSTPDRSASCLTSIPCSTHKRSTDLGWSDIPASSRAAAELRAVPVDMLDLGDVPPRDLVRPDTEGPGQAPALLRARGVPPRRDRLDHAILQPRRLDQPGQVEAAYGHPLGERFDARHAPPRVAGSADGPQSLFGPPARLAAALPRPAVFAADDESAPPLDPGLEFVPDLGRHVRDPERPVPERLVQLVPVAHRQPPSVSRRTRGRQSRFTGGWAGNAAARPALVEHRPGRGDRTCQLAYRRSPEGTMNPRASNIWAKAEVAKPGGRTGVVGVGVGRGAGAGPGRNPWPEKYEKVAGTFVRTAVSPVVALSWDWSGLTPVPVAVAVASTRPAWLTWATSWSVAVIPDASAGMFHTLVPGTNVPRVVGRARTNNRPGPKDSVTATLRARPGPMFRTARVTSTTRPTVSTGVLTICVTRSPASTGVTVVFAVLFPAFGSGWSAAMIAALIDWAPVSATLALI